MFPLHPSSNHRVKLQQLFGEDEFENLKTPTALSPGPEARIKSFRKMLEFLRPHAEYLAALAFIKSFEAPQRSVKMKM